MCFKFRHETLAKSFFAKVATVNQTRKQFANMTEEGTLPLLITSFLTKWHVQQLREREQLRFILISIRKPSNSR